MGRIANDWCIRNTIRVKYTLIAKYFQLMMSYCVILSLQGKISADILKYFSYFSQKIGYDISCQLSPRQLA